MALDLKFDRFPRPEFEGTYTLPQLQDPLPRAEWWAYADVLLLAAALGVSAWAVFGLRRHSRLVQVLNAALALGYFGFLRKGCICPVGSLQNAANALADPAYSLPLLAAAFFILPLAAALFRGRVFCGSVCPFGTLQEFVNVRPVRVPPLVDRVLGLVPPLFLITTVLAAVSGLGYLICRTDPFVGIFRWSAPLATALFGAAVLGLGVFVNRPYCRWLCPYGWLLGTASACAARTPAVAGPDCTGCGLCARSCRVDAIRVPERPGRDQGPPPRPPKRAPAALVLGLFLAAGLGAGAAAGPFLASLHPDVQLAVQLQKEEAGLVPAGSSPETRAFRSGGQDRAGLAALAADGALRIRLGALPWGVLGSLVFFAAWRGRPASGPAWSIDPRRCVACGRCRTACPRQGESHG